MQTELKITESGTIGPLPPTDWVGTDLPVGASLPWLRAPLGTTYTYIDTTNKRSRRYVKRKADGIDNDWGILGGLQCIEQRVTVAQMTDGGSTSGTIALGEKIPAGAWVQQCILDSVTGFAGDTSATIQIGDGTTVARYSTGTPSVFTTAVAIDPGVPSGTKIHIAQATITVTITSATDFTLVATNGLGVLTFKLFYLL
jgi:hypothetical protein